MICRELFYLSKINILNAQIITSRIQRKMEICHYNITLQQSTNSEPKIVFFSTYYKAVTKYNNFYIEKSQHIFKKDQFYSLEKK